MEYPLNQAMQSTLAVLAKVRPGDLDAPTPCASWDVRALVNHFVGTARWWAATIAGDGEVADADYAAGDFGRVRGEHRDRGRRVRGRRRPGEDGPAAVRRVPGTVVLGMAALDQFTHGWDLARAIGQPADLDPALAAVLLSQARLAITDAFRGPDGQAPFGPAVAVPDGAGRPTSSPPSSAAGVSRAR